MATICHKYLIKTTKSLSVDNGLPLPSFLWIWEDKTKINQIKSSVDDFVRKEDSDKRLPFTPFIFNYPKSRSFIVIDWKLSIESLALVSSQQAGHSSVLFYSNYLLPIEFGQARRSNLNLKVPLEV